MISQANKMIIVFQGIKEKSFKQIGGRELSIMAQSSEISPSKDLL